MRSNMDNAQPKPRPAALRAIFAFFRFTARMAGRVFGMALCVVLVVVVVIPPPSALFAAETDVNTVCREETRELIRSVRALKREN